MVCRGFCADGADGAVSASPLLTIVDLIQPLPSYGPMQLRSDIASVLQLLCCHSEGLPADASPTVTDPSSLALVTVLAVRVPGLGIYCEVAVTGRPPCFRT